MSTEQPHQTIGQSVGAKIRAARHARKYTQSQLARPDFSVSYISAIERGQIHPSLRALEILALRLGLASSDFLPGAMHTGTTGDSSSVTRTIQGGEAIEWEFLEAQIRIWQGAPQEAITQLRNLSSKKLEPHQELYLRYLLGWAYSRTARLQEGEYVLAEAMQFAKNPDDPMVLYILNLLGNVYTAMRNYAQGLQLHQRSLNMIEQQQPLNPFFMVQVYTNMGLHYTHLNKFDQAIEMFQRALAITEKLTSPEDMKSAYWDIFQRHSETQRYYLATLYGYKWLQIHSQEYSQSLRSQLYHHLGHALLQQDQEAAYAYLEQMLGKAASIQDQLAQASVNAHLGEWFLGHSNISEAEEYAHKAHTLAVSSGDSIIAAGVLILLGKVAFAQQQNQAGDTHTMDGLAMLESLKAFEELANQLEAYGQLLEGRGEFRQVFKYMKRAFEIRDRMKKYGEVYNDL